MRLGVYVDDVYRVVSGPGTTRISTDRAFLLFACEVGRHFDSLVLFGRTASGPPEADYALPDWVRLARLPHYDALSRIGQVARALRGTARGMWAALPDVDVVWVFGPHPFALLLVVLARLRRKQVVLGVRHDAVAYHRSRLPSRRWRPALLAIRLLEAAFRLLARRLPTTVVGVELARRYAHGGQAPAIMTVSLVSAASVASSPPSHDWSGPIRLLTVGRLEPEKNPLLLVDALARLARGLPNRVELTWVGRGPLAGEVKAYAHTLGVADRVRLEGYVPHGPELFRRYREAHAFVHVSLTEGLPQVLLEALASGTPIVATDVGGVRSALGDGTAGLLVPPGDASAIVDAVSRLVTDEDLREGMVRRGLELVRHATLEREAARVAALISEWAGRKAASTA